MNFHDMYERYYHRVYYAALKVTKNPCSAEDILQETFMKAFDKLHEVKDETKVGAWLSTIAHRKAIDFLRKDKRMVFLPLEELPIPKTKVPCVSSEVETICVRNYMEEGIKKRISTLSPKLRPVFQLNYYKQMQEKEIARELSISPSAVKSRLHRARQAMKVKLSEELIQDYTA